MAPTFTPTPRAARAAEAFLSALAGTPECEKIATCLQCGTCSGSCPVASAMDLPPRSVFAALRAEQADRVLSANTMWLCASCYACTVRCPAGIEITDVMYQLKRLAFQYNLVETGRGSLAMARSFTEVVDRTGRSSEVEFLARYLLRTTTRELPPGKAVVKMAPLGFGLFLKGRLELLAEGVKQRDGYRATVRQAAGEDARQRGPR